MNWFAIHMLGSVFIRGNCDEMNLLILLCIRIVSVAESEFRLTWSWYYIHNLASVVGYDICCNSGGAVLLWLMQSLYMAFICYAKEWWQPGIERPIISRAEWIILFHSGLLKISARKSSPRGSESEYCSALHSRNNCGTLLLEFFGSNQSNPNICAV